MDYPLQIIAMTGLGLLTQALLVLWPLDKAKSIKLLAALSAGIALSLVFSLDKDLSRIETLRLLFAVLILVFSFFYALFFKEELIPKLDNYLLFSFSAAFWYICFENLMFDYLENRIVLAGSLFLILVPALLVVRGLKKASLNNRDVLYLYIWFFLVAAGILIKQIIYVDVVNANALNITRIDAYFNGFLFLYLFSYLVYFLQGANLGNKNSHERIQWYEFVKTLEAKYAKSPVSKYQLAIIFVLQLLIYIANARYGWFSSTLLLGFWLWLVPYGIKLLKSEKVIN